MTHAQDWTFDGATHRISARAWPHENPRYVAVFSHGYAEHAGRYQHLADALVRHGGAVYAPDHAGFGRSGGPRARVDDYEDQVADLNVVVSRARADHPDAPVVLIGHSIGAMVATRYAQLFNDDLTALVLAAPVLGTWPAADALLGFDEIPDMAMDVGRLMTRDEEAARRYNDDPLVWHGAFERATLQAVVSCLKTIDSAGSLLFLPTLWLHGEADQLAPVDTSRPGVEQIRGAHLTERRYPDALHGLFHDLDQDIVIRDLTTFVDDVLP